MAFPGSALIAALSQGAGVQQQRPQRQQPGRVAWGGQQFSNPADLAAWINAHGGNAQRTFASHPGLGAAFGQRGVGQGGGLQQLPPPAGMPPPSLIGPPEQVPHPPPGLIGPPVQVPPAPGDGGGGQHIIGGYPGPQHVPPQRFGIAGALSQRRARPLY